MAYRSPEVSWCYFLMSPSLIFAEQEGSEVASSPRFVSRAPIGPVLHLLYESATPNRELPLRGWPRG
jgi:hypothetical protein